MPSQQMIDGQLELMGWRGGFADHVVNRPGHLLANIDIHPVAWILLNENLYHVSRNHNWRWVPINNGFGNVSDQSSIGPNAVPAVQKAGHEGLTILDGSNTTATCMCGPFNALARQIAWHVLGFEDGELNRSFIQGQYVTAPRTDSFDPSWDGNVRTIAQPFRAVRAMKFHNHSFSTGPEGMFMDATVNSGRFADREQFKWLSLGVPPGQVPPSPSGSTPNKSEFWIATPNPGHADMLPPGGPPYLLISTKGLNAYRGDLPMRGDGLTWLKVEGTPEQCPSNNEWPSWWLISAAELPGDLRARLRTLFGLP